VIASPGGLVCLTLGRFLCTKQGRWHFSRFGIIVGEVVRDMQGFSRGGEELNWRTFGDEGLWLHHFFLTRYTGGSVRFLPGRDIHGLCHVRYK